ncbi:MAG: EcsC family protein [Yoonia sp.]|nr:EcsC family protein [Yoonia sp.]
MMDSKLTPIDGLTAQALTNVEALAARQGRANGVLMKAITYVGGQVESGLKALPAGARTQINTAARKALEASYDAASRSRTTHHGSDRMHKVFSAISGGLGGLGGLPTALLELPIATTVIFRAVQGVAAQYGEDPLSAETRVQCLAVFGAGGPTESDDGIDTAFFSARMGLTGAAVHGVMSKVAPRFATVLTQKLASQTVPILGAAAGAGTNYAFTDYYVERAHVHFGLRKLARDHGEEAVLDAFHTALIKKPVPLTGA